MYTTRRTFIAGSLAAACGPTITGSAYAYADGSTIARHVSIALNRDVRPNHVNPRVKRYFTDPRYSQYSGVQKLWNHYHDHWGTNGYRNPTHTRKCPCCFLILFEASCGQPVLEDDFFKDYRGRNEFDWHYYVQWDSLDPTQNYSLDHYARLGALDGGGGIVDDSETGFAYYANGKQRVINFRGKEAFSFNSSQFDTNGVDSVPRWLVPCH